MGAPLFRYQDCQCGMCGSVGLWTLVPNKDQYRCGSCDNITDGRTLLLRWQKQNSLSKDWLQNGTRFDNFVASQLNTQITQITPQWLNPPPFSQKGIDPMSNPDAPKYVYDVAVTDEDDVVVYEGKVVATGPEAAIRKVVRDLDADVDVDEVKFHTTQMQHRL